MNSSDNPRPSAAAATTDEPQESGGFPSMIRFLFLLLVIFVSIAALVRWKGHRSVTSKAELSAPQTVAVQSGPVTPASVSPASAVPPALAGVNGPPPKQLGYDAALSSNEIAAIYAKVTTSIDEGRADRQR